MIITFPRTRHLKISLETDFKVLSQKTEFQNLEIWQTKHYGRIVLSNGYLQSIEYDEFIYHESLVHPAMNLSKNICKNILIIGGAEGAVLREVLRYKSVEKVTMVDIDRDFVRIAKTHLRCMHQGSFEDPRVNLVFEDGRKYLEGNNDAYDAIFVDINAPDIGSPSVFLFTVEWYNIVIEHLKKGGIFSSYSLSANLEDSYGFACITKTMQKCFYLVIPLVFNMQLDGDNYGIAIGLNEHRVELKNFDFDKSVSEKLVSKPISLDNISLYRSSLLPKYLRNFPDCLEPRIIEDSNLLLF